MGDGCPSFSSALSYFLECGLAVSRIEVGENVGGGGVPQDFEASTPALHCWRREKLPTCISCSSVVFSVIYSKRQTCVIKKGSFLKLLEGIYQKLMSNTAWEALQNHSCKNQTKTKIPATASTLSGALEGLCEMTEKKKGKLV